MFDLNFGKKLNLFLSFLRKSVEYRRNIECFTRNSKNFRMFDNRNSKKFKYFRKFYAKIGKK